LFIYLTPFIPLSFKGEGEGYLKEGLTPLLDTLDIWLFFKGEGEGYEREAPPLLDSSLSFSPYSKVVERGVLEGRSPSKETIFPFPLSRGRG